MCGVRVCVIYEVFVGSGKSYTMMGSLSDDDTKGIIPRLCDNLFERIAEVSHVQAHCHSTCQHLFGVAETGSQPSGHVQGGGVLYGNLL